MPNLIERPPIATAPISLVLIACDAAADMEPVVANWISQLDSLNRNWEIILIDDACTDGTPALADAIASRQKHVRVIHHPTKLGFGAALRSGIEAARHPLLAYTTCDRQYDPADFKKFLEQIDKVDLVTGYRLWHKVPLPLRWLGRIWRLFVRVIFGIPMEPLPSWLGDRGQKKRWLARWMFGVRVHDAECAFRLVRRSIFAHIPIQANGPFAQVEILAKANFLGCWMAEVPVTYHPVPNPAVCNSPQSGPGYLSEAYRVFSHASFG